MTHVLAIVGLVMMLATGARAAAQTRDVARTTVSEVALAEGLVGTVGPLQAVCDRAAQEPWAVEYRGFGASMDCKVRSLGRHALASIAIRFGGGMRVYVARRERGDVRVLHLLDTVEWLMTEGGDIRVTRVTETATRSRDTIVAIETRSEFVNYEATEAVGSNARRLTLCVVPRTAPTSIQCSLSVPLFYETWLGNAPPGGFASDGFAVTSRTSAEAIAVPRPDGQLRLTLRRGSWHLLYGGDWFNPDPASLPTTPRHAVFPIGRGR